jgi:saccharopine dehydrogenase-like NADP-dependent oxidoreductase
MTRVLLCGAGKIGRMIAKLLSEAGDYQVRVGDTEAAALEFLQQHADVETVLLNATDRDSLASAMRDCEIVISALSYHFNPLVAEVAQAAGASYFDLTEDIETTRRVRAVSQQAAPGQIFMPQCGLAPGFVSIRSKCASAPCHSSLPRG